MFVPVTRYALRCDGTTTHGQCDELLTYPDPDDGTRLAALWEQPEFGRWDRSGVTSAGWLVLHDGRVLCKRHVDSGARMAQAALEGLPFDEEVTP
ncbi:MAG TPA: hypothetical protein VGL02_32205 [Streptomyces sp.]